MVNVTGTTRGFAFFLLITTIPNRFKPETSCLWKERINYSLSCFCFILFLLVPLFFLSIYFFPYCKKKNLLSWPESKVIHKRVLVCLDEFLPVFLSFEQKLKTPFSIKQSRIWNQEKEFQWKQKEIIIFKNCNKKKNCNIFSGISVNKEKNLHFEVVNLIT